jgi:hypothetical protein
MRGALLIIIAAVTDVAAVTLLEPSQTCKTCHPIIYDEYVDSAHRNASTFNDKVHKAVWDKHPLKSKQKYSCAKCHTPTDTALMEALEANESALPQNNQAQTHEAITCAYCHRIESVREHAQSNANILTGKEKSFFSARQGEEETKKVAYRVESSYLGLVTKKSGSPFHSIDFSNKNFYDGKLCMGCHSHKQNAHQLEICAMEITQEKGDKENCITCHMPLIQGSFTTAVDSKTHRYHGFTGTVHKPKMLSQYVSMSLTQCSNGFDIIIKNGANHQLLLHPLRAGELRVVIGRNGKLMPLEPVRFMRVIGKDAKPSAPWVADTVLEDTQIKAKVARSVHFDVPLHGGDVVDVQLGHYQVAPEAAVRLGLDDQDRAAKFTLFKKEHFVIER